MQWMLCHSAKGLNDSPHVMPFDDRIHDYWVNDAGTRIGARGISKGVAHFTYRKDNLNFTFSVNPNSDFESDNATLALGPACTVYIDRTRRISTDERNTVELRDDLFNTHSIIDIKSEIETFIRELGDNIEMYLSLFNRSGFYKPIAIKTIYFPLERADLKT